MHSDISKFLADFLRSQAAAQGVKLKASHAHELVAAFFGYNTHAALLADTQFPIDQLDEVEVLVPPLPLIDERRGQLNGVPSLPATHDLVTSLVEALVQGGYFHGKAWIYESLSAYVMEVLLPEEDGQVSDDLSGVMATTNAYFDDAIYEDAEVEDDGDTLTVTVTGTYSGSNHEDQTYCGHQIDMTVTVEFVRIAGGVGFAKPEISASGAVNNDWWDDEPQPGSNAAPSNGQPQSGPSP